MSTNPTPTPGPDPTQAGLEQFGVPAITANMIRAMKLVAKAKNTTAIANYNNVVEKVTNQNAFNKAVGLPAIPFPEPPALLVVNEALIAKIEAETFDQSHPDLGQDADWANVFFEVPYVPVPPAAPTHPAIVINLDAFEGPGLYGANGDGPDVPVGTTVAGPGGVGSFKKTIIGRSPFAPGGIVTAWQQVG